MAIDLASMWRRARNPRRKEVVLRPARVPSTMATNLYTAVYAPVIAEWEQAVAGFVAAYERSLAEMQTDSPADIRADLDQTEGVVARLSLLLRERLTRWARMTEAQHRRRWTASVLTATGVDLRTVIGPEATRLTIETVIERNVSLVQSVSDQARQRIADAVFRGFTKRSPATDIARELREAIAMGRRRARLIASDQTAKLASALDQERRREAGIDTWEWVHSGAAHPREEHEDRDGNRYSDDDPPEDMPGELVNCKCTSRAVLVLE